MERQVLEYDSDVRMDKYFSSIFSRLGKEYNIDRDGGRTLVIFKANEDMKRDLICGVINTFFKFKEVVSFLPEQNKCSYYSFVGSIIGMEQEDDVIKISEHIDEKTVYLNGFYNFCLTELRSEWRDLAEISAKLYAQCLSDEDVYALSVFMLGTDIRPFSTIVIEGDKLFKDKGEEILVIPYYDDPVKDGIVTLVSSRPSDIVVPSPESVSDKMLNVIRSLGE